MPTYEYACVECGHHVEVVQSMSASPLTVCAACGGRLRKVFAPIGIVFKGSGFYRTDSRGKAPAKSSTTDGATSEKSSAKTGSSSGSSGSGKSDSSSSKPAEKSA